MWGAGVCVAGAAEPASRPSPKIGPNLAALWKSTAAPSYAKASAHAPNFDDKALWPILTGKEYFLTTKWAPAKLYVWAKPGENGQFGTRGHLDPTKPENWLVDGKPATELKFGEEADLLLPAADKPYTIGFRGSPVREVFRHITVEANAKFIGGGDGAGRTAYGNVWVKKGGEMYSQGATSFLGTQHAFMRNDNEVAPDKLNEAGNMCAQYFTFNKEGASMELLGFISVLDEYRVHGGICIIGIDTIMHPGRSATPVVDKPGTLCLLDGAYWGKWTNEFHRAIDLECSGTVQGGLPERPLKRDCTIGLSFRNWQKLDFSKWSADPKKGMKQVRLVSAIFRPGAKIVSITDDPAKACLNITWTGIDRTNVVGDPAGKDDKGKGMFAQADFAEQFNSIPRKITMYFDSGATVEKVRFDNVHAGGILIKDEQVKAGFKNVLYGPGCTAKGDELFKQVELGRGGDW
jgi:hypothetical protein